MSLTCFQHKVRTIDNSRPLCLLSRSFKVTDFCCNRKHIYDFLLVINCHLSSILHRLRDTASQVENHSTLFWAHRLRGSLRILSSNLAGNELRHWATFLLKTACSNCSRFVTIHSRHRQTDDRRHILTITERCIATVGWKMSSSILRAGSYQQINDRRN